MQIQGISHITFVVNDLARMAIFLCDRLGAVEVYDSEAKNYSISREKFFLLGGIWIVAMEGGSLYFYDFDNNLFELHTRTLEQRLERYSK